MKKIKIGFPIEYEDENNFIKLGLFLRENEAKALEKRLTDGNKAIELKSRIDKAIEYITTEQLYTNYQWGKSQYAKILKDLLNILLGKDENK